MNVFNIFLTDFNQGLDLESIGSSLVFEGELIWAGLVWKGPDIRSGLVNRHLIIEGHWDLDLAPGFGTWI